MSDSAGKKYLERPSENTLIHWLVTSVVLMICAAMLLSPVWIPMLWPK